MVKATQKRRRGIPANGAEIRRRREAMGLSQQGLLDANLNAGVTKRTLQRAENGDNISQAQLQEIANLLDNTTLEDIVLSQDGGTATKNILVLDRLDPPSGKALFNQLYDSVDVLTIDFDVDPTEEQASVLAELCDRLEAVRRAGSFIPWDADDDKIELFDNPAAKIKAIGRLNSTLRSLADDGTYVFIGAFRQWQRDTQQIKGPRGDGYCPKTKRRDHVVIIFSGSASSSLTIKRVQKSQSEVEQEIVAEALDCPIHPDDFATANDPWGIVGKKEICKEYRRLFIEKFGEERADPNYADYPFPNEGVFPF